jgi:hypothetical protein
MIPIFGLQRAGQKFELGKTSQTREAGIFQELRPASEAGLTLRSSQPKAVSRLPVRASVRAI